MDKKTAGNMSVPCGRCKACRLSHSAMWMIRMMHELRYHEKSAFTTLTYSDENLPENGTLVKKHVQDYLKRLRKNTGVKMKYYAAGEYGSQYKRPHYHLIMYGLGKEDEKQIDQAWNRGHTMVGDVTEASCMYVAKYVTKKLNGPLKKVYEEKGIIPEFSLMSKGIGQKYANEYRGEIVNRGYVINKGVKHGIPKYYIRKYTETGYGSKVFENRTNDFKLKAHKERIDKLHENGYEVMHREEVNRREHGENSLAALLKLKGEKL